MLHVYQWLEVIDDPLTNALRSVLAESLSVGALSKSLMVALGMRARQRQCRPILIRLTGSHKAVCELRHLLWLVPRQRV